MSRFEVRGICTSLLVLSGVLMLARPGFGQWQNAVRITDVGEAASKTGRLVASKNGGFHATWIQPDTGAVRYKRWNGTLGSGITLPGTGVNFIANPNITEALNGDVHIFWENWAGDTPEGGWSKSTTGGASWSTAIEITSTGGHFKFPWPAPYGTGTSDDVMLCYWNANTNNLRSRLYNGSSWGTDTYLGSNGSSQYEVEGVARSPVDGSIWKVFTNGGALKLRQFTGSWGPEVTLDSNGQMHNRQRVAVNNTGQVMVMWDEGDAYYSILYTPGTGVGAKTTITTQASWAKGLTAIPGTGNFYCVYWKDTAQHIYGRKWAGGGWLPEEQVSVGVSADFMADADVSAGPDGALYVIFEYWLGENPVTQYYTYKPAPPAGSSGTLSGTVRNQFGAGIPGAMVSVVGVDATVSGAGGAYSIPVVAGTYSVNASKNYYATQSFNNISIVANQTTTRDFTITGNAPGLVANFTATPISQANNLAWTNPGSGNYTGTMVRFSTAGYPNSPTEGTLVVDLAGSPGAASNHQHTGLTNGITYFYSAFSYYNDTSRYYAVATTAEAAPAGPADLDRDGDVDLSDFAQFQRCLTGSANPQNDSNCSRAKMDGDADVDADDLDRFLGCMSGAGIPSNPNCN